VTAWFSIFLENAWVSRVMTHYPISPNSPYSCPVSSASRIITLPSVVTEWRGQCSIAARFLSRTTTALAATLAFRGNLLAQLDKTPALPDHSLLDKNDDSYWAELRKQFLIPEDEIYLNNGTVGSSPAPVLRAIFDGYNATEKMDQTSLRDRYRERSANRFAWISRTGCGRPTKSVSAAVTPTSSVSPRPTICGRKISTASWRSSTNTNTKRNCCKTEAAQSNKVTLSSKERIGETHQSEVQGPTRPNCARNWGL